MTASPANLDRRATPWVDAEIDPAQSYWRDHVHYPWPNHVAQVPDGRGRIWEIAYVDLYLGSGRREAAPTLIMLHGRGMNSAYWGALLDRPLAAGWRIVAIDLPHAGKSLPGNLHLLPTRSLEDIRAVVHHLVAGQLGIARATYLGHSLGGQAAAGYALEHPEHVERLVLYAPAGLELIHPMVVDGVRLDDPQLADDYDTFYNAWTKIGPVVSMGRTVEAIEQSFYAPLWPGAGTYLQRGDPLAEYIVASRSGILRGNPAECERAAQMYTWEIFASFIECRHEDAGALPRRFSEFSMPTLITIGLDETIYLGAATGNKDLVRDVVAPLHADIRRLKSPVSIKLYPGGSHFMHVALGQQLSGDMLAFLQGDTLAGLFGEGAPAS